MNILTINNQSLIINLKGGEYIWLQKLLKN